MSKNSRQRFRPTWMGSVNRMRDKYLPAYKREWEQDEWNKDWESDGHFVGLLRDWLCEEHVRLVAPVRKDYGSVGDYLQAIERQSLLPDLVKACEQCGRENRHGRWEHMRGRDEHAS